MKDSGILDEAAGSSVIRNRQIKNDTNEPVHPTGEPVLLPYKVVGNLQVTGIHQRRVGCRDVSVIDTVCVYPKMLVFRVRRLPKQESEYYLMVEDLGRQQAVYSAACLIRDQFEHVV